MTHHKESPQFRRLLLNAIVVPLILMTIITATLIWQIHYLLRDSSNVEHADRIIAKINKLQKLTIDLETGLRGFLITGDDRFLAPYNDALNDVGTEERQLRNYIGEDAELQELNRLSILRKKWLEYAAAQIALRRQNGDYISVVRSLKGKDQVDRMRAVFSQMADHEILNRDVRFRDAERASKITLALIAGFGIGGGILLALLSRKQFLQITQNYDSALQTANDLNQKLEMRVGERTLELTDLNRELEAFSYSISHDLRAPMRHIAGFANLLDASIGPELKPDDKENLTTIHETAKLAGKMVDDLLMFSRVGRTPLRVIPVDLNALLIECRRELILETKGRHIEWKINPLPLAAGDPSMIKMVIANLLANAIKYTNKREKTEIEIGCSRDAPPPTVPAVLPNHVTCFVKDNGVGFDMAYAGKLFGVFQRLHRSEEFEGTGIGLANVRRIIGRSGGRVWANGELDKGATFYFTVPLARLDES